MPVMNLPSLSLVHPPKSEEETLVPREVTAAAADGGPGSPAGRTDLLLRFFDSEFFNEWIAVQCVPSQAVACLGEARVPCRPRQSLPELPSILPQEPSLTTRPTRSHIQPPSRIPRAPIYHCQPAVGLLRGVQFNRPAHTLGYADGIQTALAPPQQRAGTALRTGGAALRFKMGKVALLTSVALRGGTAVRCNR